MPGHGSACNARTRCSTHCGQWTIVHRWQRGGRGAAVSDSLKKISAMSLFVENLHEAKSFYQDVFDVQVVHEDEVSVAVKFDNLIINLLQVSEASALVEPGVVPGRDAGSRFQLSIWAVSYTHLR